MAFENIGTEGVGVKVGVDVAAFHSISTALGRQYNFATDITVLTQNKLKGSLILVYKNHLY